MSTSTLVGYEGFEKRLELTFCGSKMSSAKTEEQGLRALKRYQLDCILKEAHCTILKQLSNSQFDSYILCESSLFVYPFKMILKTCGTTKLLLSIPTILQLAESLSLVVCSVMYTRGSFSFPNAQPSPHRSFSEEVSVLDHHFSSLHPITYVMGDPALPKKNWHIYCASESPLTDTIKLEMCMTGLDKKKGSVFFKGSDKNLAGKMTNLSGINTIIPTQTISDLEYEPCGYSMNAIEGEAYSTVHVAPEEAWSYASYEAVGLDPKGVSFDTLLNKVIGCFRPAEFSVAVTFGRGAAIQWVMESAAGVVGYKSDFVMKKELPHGGCVLYKTYMAMY